MLKAISKTGKAGSISEGMGISALASITITMSLSGLIASLLSAEKITWVQAGYWIMGMLFVAAFISGKCACMIIQRQKAIISLMSGILYWSILLCITGLFFGGNFEALPQTAGIIMAGSLAQLLLSKSGTGKQRRRGSHVVKLTKTKGR